jgi:hypothetical protein
VFLTLVILAGALLFQSLGAGFLSLAPAALAFIGWFVFKGKK